MFKIHDGMEIVQQFSKGVHLLIELQSASCLSRFLVAKKLTAVCGSSDQSSMFAPDQTPDERGLSGCQKEKKSLPIRRVELRSYAILV